MVAALREGGTALSEGNSRTAANPAHALPGVAGNALCPGHKFVLPISIVAPIAKTLLWLLAVEMEEQKVKGYVLVTVLGVVFATPLIQKPLEAEEGARSIVAPFWGVLLYDESCMVV